MKVSKKDLEIRIRELIAECDQTANARHAAEAQLKTANNELRQTRKEVIRVIQQNIILGKLVQMLLEEHVGHPNE